MPLRTLLGDLALPSQTQGPGTYPSGELTSAGNTQTVRATLIVSAVTGTPSVTISLQSSPDTSTWTTIPGTTSSALTAAGSVTVSAFAPDEYLQVLVTITGSSTTATFAVPVEVLVP